MIDHRDDDHALGYLTFMVFFMTDDGTLADGGSIRRVITTESDLIGVDPSQSKSKTELLYLQVHQHLPFSELTKTASRL